jgi:hypothetical protein
MMAERCDQADLMSTKRAMCALIVAFGACGQAKGGEGAQCDPSRPHLLQRIGPAGGWHPDCGGVWHWWNPRCFVRTCGPDDYCRKPPPSVCRPCDPPFYIWGPPAVAHP